MNGSGVPSGGCGSTTNRSILTGSKEDNKNNNIVMSTEVNSSYPVVDESLDGLELGLGLSIGGLKSKSVRSNVLKTGSNQLVQPVEPPGGWSQYARILTAKDFPTSLVSKPNSCSSSCSVNIPNSFSSGTKRTATDSVSPPNGTSVVGWPPVSKAHRCLIWLAKSSHQPKTLSQNLKKTKARTEWLESRIIGMEEMGLPSRNTDR